MKATIEECDTQISGEGIFVQIDGCKLSKLKNNDNHKGEGL